MSSAPVTAKKAPAPAARLESDAIGVAQDTVIGMASAAPGVSVGLTLAALAAATAYTAGPVILITAVPMLMIANAYRLLNMWNADCGVSFEWVGRAISPSLGFLTGWPISAAGVLLAALYGLKSRFFALAREADPGHPASSAATPAGPR